MSQTNDMDQRDVEENVLLGWSRGLQSRTRPLGAPDGVPGIRKRKTPVARISSVSTNRVACFGTRRAIHNPTHNGPAMYSKMLAIKFSMGRSLRRAVCGITSTATGVNTMLTADKTEVITAANANRICLRVNCSAIGVPGMAASSRMPTAESGVSGKSFTKRKPIPGMRTRFASSVRVNRARLRKTSSNSPPLTRSPIESITRNTKKFSNGNGRTNMSNYGNPLASI